jgi:site-specific recombinase XerD
LIGYFIEYLETATAKSPLTIKNIKRDLERFADFVDGETGAPRQEISPGLIKQYIELLEEEYRESSFISKLSSLRQFVNWLNLDNNPFWSMKFKVSNEDFFFYAYEDIASKLLEPIGEPCDYSRLIATTVYELYLSVDELLALKLGDYNLAASQLRVRGRDLRVSELLAREMKQYLKIERNKITGPGPVGLNDPLFISEPKPLREQDLRQILLSYGFKPLYLKRSRIVHLMDQGLSLNDIEHQLGIKVSLPLKTFVKEPDYRLLKAYNEFHPRAGS